MPHKRSKPFELSNNFKTSAQREHGFSLLETAFAMGIMLTMGLAVISGIIFTRQMMELDKQRLAALAYARRVMEEAQNTSSTLDGGPMMELIPFNSPGQEISAAVGVSFYAINDDGTVSTSALPSVPSKSLTKCRVTVIWRPSGTIGYKQQRVSLESLVTGTTTL
ncbi:MAG: PulJ/GspJ family protein [Candidatus Sumerlaeaceae bacterium]